MTDAGSGPSPRSPAGPVTGSPPGSRVAASGSGDSAALEARTPDERRLVLSDLVNRVLDRGLMITGSVTLAVADIDLVQLDLNIVLTSVETAFRRQPRRPAG